MDKLHVEKISSDRYFDMYSVDGLSVEDMNEILHPADGKSREDALVEVFARNKNDSWYGENIAEAWRYGYGIYSIRHVGGSLLIEVGNSCD